MCSVEATLLGVRPLCLGAGNPPQELRLRVATVQRSSGVGCNKYVNGEFDLSHVIHQALQALRSGIG